MYALMHLSDLHRSPETHISNNVLLADLLADSERYSKEAPAVPSPDAIVVTGDLVVGVPLGTTDHQTILERQYEEAFGLLGSLVDTFLGGDRTRIIILPGNHDVDWNTARSAMVAADPMPEKIHKHLAAVDSPYRWDWEERALYIVADEATYDSRFEIYGRHYADFYAGAALRVPLEPARAWNVFLLDEDRIAVVAFNSCYRNDCYRMTGDIPEDAVADAYFALRAHAPSALWMAAWHHDTAGPPLRSDYLDQTILASLIYRGVRLAVHGHRHSPDASPHHAFTHERETMALVSAGSLCAGPVDLPAGVNRQYNVIEIADDYGSARVHVREVLVGNVFGPGRAPALGTRSYADASWTLPPQGVPADARRPPDIPALTIERAERALASGDPETALTALAGYDLGNHSYGRRLYAEALARLGRWPDLVTLLNNPQTIDELTKLVYAIIELRDWALGDLVVASLARHEYADEATRKTLTETYQKERAYYNDHT